LFFLLLSTREGESWSFILECVVTIHIFCTHRTHVAHQQQIYFPFYYSYT
jgi:hypothetical protein